MASCGTLRDNMQTRLETITGLKAYDVATAKERLPAAIIFPASVNQRTSCDGEEWAFLVEIHCGLGKGLARAQDELDAYISTTGTKSIRVALDGDKTLGGAASSLRVEGFQSYGFANLNAVETLSAIIPVTVTA